jgi:hypothetical protein
MTLILSGTNGLSDVDGDASTPAIRGSDSNTGIFFGTDIIGFSEGGTECGRFNSSGNLQTIGTISVGNATPSTSGAGITFPAAQSASSDANTLDDYEEGTWTPTDNSGAGLTFTNPRGVYTKVGRVVTAHFNLTFPSTASADNITISLPFTSANLFGGGTYGNAGCISYTNGSGTDFQTLFIGSNAANFLLFENGVAQTNASYSTQTLAGTLIFITAT